MASHRGVQKFWTVFEIEHSGKLLKNSHQNMAVSDNILEPVPSVNEWQSSPELSMSSVDMRNMMCDKRNKCVN